MFDGDWVFRRLERVYGRDVWFELYGQTTDAVNASVRHLLDETGRARCAMEILSMDIPLVETDEAELG